jgi:hypothetical protein
MIGSTQPTAASTLGRFSFLFLRGLVYEVDNLDRVIELSSAAQPDVGAPLPLVVSDERHLFLAYIVSERDPAWDGSYVTVVSPESSGLPIAIVQFRWPSAHMFGPPNDEAFGGHPLASRGLSPYAVFEVEKSSWIRKHERMNSVHPSHDRERFLKGRKHFVFAFHDSTFECIAEGFETSVIRGSMRAAAGRIVEMLADQPPG